MLCIPQSLSIRLFRVTSRTLVGGGSPLCWVAISVFYNLSRLGNLCICWYHFQKMRYCYQDIWTSLLISKACNLTRLIKIHERQYWKSYIRINQNERTILYFILLYLYFTSRTSLDSLFLSKLSDKENHISKLTFIDAQISTYHINCWPYGFSLLWRLSEQKATRSDHLNQRSSQFSFDYIEGVIMAICLSTFHSSSSQSSSPVIQSIFTPPLSSRTFSVVMTTAQSSWNKNGTFLQALVHLDLVQWWSAETSKKILKWPIPGYPPATFPPCPCCLIAWTNTTEDLAENGCPEGKSGGGNMPTETTTVVIKWAEEFCWLCLSCLRCDKTDVCQAAVMSAEFWAGTEAGKMDLKLSTRKEYEHMILQEILLLSWLLFFGYFCLCLLLPFFSLTKLTFIFNSFSCLFLSLFSKRKMNYKFFPSASPSIFSLLSQIFIDFLVLFLYLSFYDIDSLCLILFYFMSVMVSLHFLLSLSLFAFSFSSSCSFFHLFLVSFYIFLLIFVSCFFLLTHLSL